MGSAAAEQEIKKRAILEMTEFSIIISVPFSLYAVVRLNVADAIWASGTNAALSAAEILARLHPPPPPTASPAVLQRLLRVLSSYGVFCELHEPPSPRRYSLTEMGKTLVQSDADHGSYAAYILQQHQEELVWAWPLLHEAVLDPTGPEPFAKANEGLGMSDYCANNLEANTLMQQAMWGLSASFMETFLDGYEGGFEGIETLVEVGGSSGKCLKMIMDRVPSVQIGINFDLPDIVAKAPDFPGVKHVAGDMLAFNTIPAGDAIFMERVLTAHSDEECKKLLENCYSALGGGGKVIACEPVLPEETDNSQRTRALLEKDVLMMVIHRSQTRERTEQEFQRLGLSGGFSIFRAIHLDHLYTVLEFIK